MKNLNLIKRLWTDSHEKQKVRGMQKYCILFLLLLTCVTHAWASTTFNDGDVLFYDFTAVTGGGGVNWQVNGSTMVCDQNGAGTIKCVIFTKSTTWTTDWTLAKTAKGRWVNIKMPSDRPSGKNCLKINAEGTGASWTTISLAEKVAKGDFIMVYGGEPSGWGDKENYRFRSAQNDDNTIAFANRNYTRSINGTNYIFGPAVLPVGNTSYYQGHWASSMKCSVTAGSAYVVGGSQSSTDYFEQKANSGSDYLYRIKKQSSTPTTSLSPTCPSSITEGEKLSFTPGSAGVSVLGYTNTIKYYLKSGSTYTEKTLSDGKIDVSDLATGDYSIITLLYDGHIYVKASTSNFSVVGSSTYDVTVYDGDHGTVDPNGIVNVGGAGVSLEATADEGYHFTSWTKGGTVANIALSSTTTNPTTLTATGTGGTVTANYAINTYTIHFDKNDGSRVGTATGSMDDITGVEYGETVALTENAFALAHYTFTGWATSSGGSKAYNDQASVSNLSSTHNGTANLYAVWTEIPYTVTLQNATESSVSAGCGTGHSITAASAPFGMGFDHWEVVSGSATFVNANSATTTVKATSDCTVKAVYTQKLYAFIEGRFHVADASSPRNWTNTFSEGNWDQNSTRIPFSYDATRHVFYLHTYAKASELSTQISSIDPYFYIKTSSSSSSASDGSATIKSYKCNSSGTVISTVGYDNKIQFDYIHNNTTDTKKANLRFNSSDVTAYITIFFDGTYIWYEYMPAIINTINLSGTRVPPMAEITATPSMSYKGATDKAYCWGVYSDEECTSPVNVSFTSLGSGRVQFTVPQTIGTYYLKLTVRASAACNASIDDEEVQSFNVTTDNMVFFNKTDIPWSRVFVYFLGDGSYWDDNLGSGCASKDYGRANEMHRIGKSDIYYYEYSGNALGNNDIQYIAFTEYGKPSSEHFAYTNAAYRGDFKRSCAPMYVPENWITHRLNNCEYYNRGYWTTYGVSGVARNAGFTLKVFDGFDGGTQLKSVDLSNTDGSNTYRATVNLTEVNYSYAYQLLSCGNKYYGNDGVMNANNSTNWKFEPDKHRCGLNFQASGNYDFIVQCTDGGEVRVSVEFPLMNGDYRLIYNDTCVYQTGWHPSQFIRHNYSDGAKLDTVSMYIRPNKQPTLKIQVCDDASSTPPTWRDSITYDVSGLTYGHGVYNFYLSQEDGKLTINDVRPYTGLYYIRTQQADGGWTGYKTNSDNVMTYTEYAEQKNYGFNYYKAKWVGTTGADVTFTIANDYSESLCDTMVADPGNNPLTAAEARSLPHTASVRFGWNSATNTLHRAYINGTSIVSDRYLVMIGDEKMKDKDGKALTEAGGGKVSGLGDYEMNFTDLNNWIYRCDVKAQTGAAVRLVANYDGHTQHFIGTAEKPEEIIGGSSGEEYLMRVTYDFKTNRLMTAWLPDGDAITSNMTLKADMMLIREGQNAATQVYFDEGYKDKTISEIHSIYGVMEFQYSKFANQFPNWSAPHAYEYLMYYISFPFDVKVSEIFGCGVRGKNWIIQKYNGAKRAKIGWFAETSTFWETLPGDSTLHAHEGYLLLLDRISFNDPGSNVWTNRPEKVYLYFPSASRTIGTIKDNNEKVIIKIPSHTCKIERPFTPDIDGWSGGELVHSNTDSHWNVFGTPLFQSKAATTVGDSELKYFYSWNYTDNTLRPEVTLAGDTVFKAMHGYMVQFAGDVTFTGAHISASVAVRRMPSNKHYLAELQLVSENGDENATYVELRENANTDFQLNEDMYMMRSSNTVDLYSFAGAYDVAANVLPIDDQLVRVGVDVKRAGTYRFTMPSEFSGTVTLIDNLMGTRTNMALGDHEVYLERGVDNNRFFLEININKMPTAIDGVDGGSLKDGKAHKFIENGQMYILKDGIIYDARGNRVQ